MPNTLFTYLTPIELWRLTHFGITENTGDAANTVDFDHDGLHNLVEYGLVLSPTGFSCTPPTEMTTYPEGKRRRILLTRDPGRTDVTIEVQAGTDLLGWTTIATSTAGAPFNGPGYVSADSATPGLKTIEIRDTVNLADAPRRFLRVRVTY